jgi:hypothetical protein
MRYRVAGGCTNIGRLIQNNVALADYLRNIEANAGTANMGYDRQTAVVMLPSVLAGARPEFTLTHELLLHAYAAQSTMLYSLIRSSNKTGCGDPLGRLLRLMPVPG